MLALILPAVSAASGADETKVPFYKGLSNYTRRVTTVSPEAQRYFDQGLAFTYGVDHEVASRCTPSSCRPGRRRT